MNKNIFIILTIFLASGLTIVCMEEKNTVEEIFGLAIDREAVLGLPILQLEEKSDEKSKTDDNALFWAVDNGIQEIVEYLVDHGENVNLQKESDGQTPLTIAISKGHKYLVAFLINKGAKLDLANFKGNTPLIFAISKGHKDVVEFLVNKGANPNLQNFQNLSPLMIAASTGYIDVVEFLINKGANPNLQDVQGNTALVYAARNKHQGIVSKLSTLTNLNLLNRKGVSQAATALRYLQAPPVIKHNTLP